MARTVRRESVVGCLIGQQRVALGRSGTQFEDLGATGATPGVPPVSTVVSTVDWTVASTTISWASGCGAVME